MKIARSYLCLYALLACVPLHLYFVWIDSPYWVIAYLFQWFFASLGVYYARKEIRGSEQTAKKENE